MRFDLDGAGEADIVLTKAVVAGWTARDPAQVAHHIAELAAIGVAAPSATPLFYRVAPGLLTQADEIAVLGGRTSGEAEPMLLRHGGALWLGLASDHTDRALEAWSVAHSKQVCAKPVAHALWPLAPLAGRLDALMLRSWIDEGAGWTLYQEGPLALIRPLLALEAACPLPEGGAMLCGTLGAIGGVRPAARFRMALRDEAEGREIAAEYRIAPLPVIA